MTIYRYQFAAGESHFRIAERQAERGALSGAAAPPQRGRSDQVKGYNAGFAMPNVARINLAVTMGFVKLREMIEEEEKKALPPPMSPEAFWVPWRRFKNLQ